MLAVMSTKQTTYNFSLFSDWGRVLLPMSDTIGVRVFLVDTGRRSLLRSCASRPSGAAWQRWGLSTSSSQVRRGTTRPCFCGGDVGDKQWEGVPDPCEVFTLDLGSTTTRAVTNHYSAELRARLQGAKLPTNYYFKPEDVNGIR